MVRPTQAIISLIELAIIALAIHDRYLCPDCSETRLFMDRWLIYIAAIVLLVLSIVVLRKGNPIR